MFVLQDADGKRLQVLEDSQNMVYTLLRDDEPHKYPTWSQIDPYSSTYFHSDDVDDLIADLERLKNPEELSTQRQQWRRGLEQEIARIEAERARRYSSTMWSPPPDPKLNELREELRLAEQKPERWPKHLREENIAPFVDSIISMAWMCREIGGALVHEW